MAENSISETPKRNIKVGYLFLSLVPIAVNLMIQTIAQLPFLILSMFDAFSETSVFDYNTFMNLFYQKYSAYVYYIYGGVGVIVFALWYLQGFVKKNAKVRLKDVFSLKSVLSIIALVVGLFFAINAFMILIGWILPKIMESYSQLMELTGIITNPVVIIVYGLFLGPVLEELCFRGVAYSILEKSGINIFFVILIQSLFFGAMHLILVQVIYAAILGMFLGYLRYKYRSISITIVMHILFNFMGTFVGDAIDKVNPGDGVILILGGISMVVIAFTIVLINSDKKAYHP